MLGFGAEQVCVPCHLNRRQWVSVAGLVQEWPNLGICQATKVELNG
jgi:hypothetical protein